MWKTPSAERRLTIFELIVARRESVFALLPLSLPVTFSPLLARSKQEVLRKLGRNLDRPRHKERQPIDRSKRYAESTTRSHPVIQQLRVHRAERKHESRVLERGRTALHGLFYSLSIAVQFHFRRFTPHFERFCSLARYDRTKFAKKKISIQLGEIKFPREEYT